MKNHTIMLLSASKTRPALLILPAFLLLLMTISPGDAHGQVKIGRKPKVLMSSSLLELESDSSGFLLPRLSDQDAERLRSKSDADGALGLLIYNSDSASIQVFDTTGSGEWHCLLTEHEGWSTTGNHLGNPRDFIGTLDSTDFRIWADSTHFLSLTTRGALEVYNTGNSVFIGENAGESDNGQSNANVGVGYQSLKGNSTGEGNVSVGAQSMILNSSGNNNVAVGQNALRNNQSGHRNVAIGEGAGQANSTGFNNTALGYRSLYKNTSGIFNVGVGSAAMAQNSTGARNTAVGVGAMEKNQTGSNNCVSGYYAFQNHKSGAENVVLGYFAMYGDTTGTHNTAVGAYTMNSNRSGKQNVAVGYRALQGGNGSGNVALGFQAGYYETGSNKLYIDNSAVATPLIHGDFASNDLTVNGDLSYTGSLTSLSDQRLKTKIRPMGGMLKPLISLEPKRYRFADSMSLLYPSGEQVGLVAQEVERILPNLVHRQASGYLGVDYVGLIPYLIGGIQELHQRVEELETELKSLSQKQ